MGNADVAQKYFIFLFVSILTSNIALAQKTPAKKIQPNIYKNIESFQTEQFTKFMLGWFFDRFATSFTKTNN